METFTRRDLFKGVGAFLGALLIAGIYDQSLAQIARELPKKEGVM